MSALTAKELEAFRKLEKKMKAPQTLISEKDLEAMENRVTGHFQRQHDFLNQYTGLSLAFHERIKELEQDNTRLISQIRWLKEQLPKSPEPPE